MKRWSVLFLPLLMAVMCLALFGQGQGGAPGGGAPGGGGGGRGGGGNPQVEPGIYKVTMTANGKTYTSAITVRRDPMLKGDAGQ